jgi:hypothetical protein
MEDMDKTRLKGPVYDYYRFQEQPDKIHETHETVPANRTNFRVI